MTAFFRIMAGVLSLLLLWVIVGISLPFLTNGFFYHIQTPVPVHAVSDQSLFLSFERWARFAMNGRCSRELVCNYTIELGESPCPIEPGEDTAIFFYEIPEGVTGPCVLRGHVRYRPFGVFGPELTTPWESEEFTLNAH